MVHKNYKTIFICLLLFMMLLVGCSQTNEDDKKPDDADKNAKAEEEVLEDVTLTFLNSMTEESFNEKIKSVIEEVYPHITLEYVAGSTNDFEEVIAKGIVPDLYRVVNIDHADQRIVDFDMDFALDDLIEQFDFDLNTIDPSLIKFLRNQNPEGKITALPYNKTVWATYYNKDIFDLFGVDYPTDNMTWDEILELAKKVTGERNGIQYRGLSVDIPFDAATAFPVNMTDPETGEARLLEDPAFSRFFTMIEELTSIPGNYPDGSAHFHTWGAEFPVGNVAMMPYYGPGLNYLETEDFEWDLVTYPSWDEQPNVGPQANGHAYAISPHSEHKEDAFRVISYIASKDYQMKLSKSGTPPAVIDQEVLEAFGTDVEGVDGKNFAAIFGLEYTPGPEVESKYDALAGGLWGTAAQFYDSGEDVNTYLRKLNEQFNTQVKERKVEKGWD